MLLLEGIFSVR